MADSTPRKLPARRLQIDSRALASSVISIVLLIVVWEGSVIGFDLPAYVLPLPLDVWHALVAGLAVDPTSRASFWYQLASTMQAACLGFVIGSALGIVLAAMMAESRAIERILLPYLVGLQSLPKIAIAPLYVIWFGYQLESKVAMAATVVLFPVLINSFEGFAATERERLELMTSLDASRWQTFRMIRLPGALPFIFTGLNLGIVYALLGTIVAEFIGAQRGMGVIITQLQAVSDTAGVFAALVVLSVAGYVLIAIVRAVQKRIVFWTGSGQTIDSV